MKKRIMILAAVLVVVLGTSVAFAWTHFYSFNKSIGANSNATVTFNSTSNFVLNYTQSVPNVTYDKAKVKIVISKDGGTLSTHYVTGDNVSEIIAVNQGSGSYRVKFYNQSPYTINVSGSAMK